MHPRILAKFHSEQGKKETVDVHRGSEWYIPFKGQQVNVIQ